MASSLLTQKILWLLTRLTDRRDRVVLAQMLEAPAKEVDDALMALKTGGFVTGETNFSLVMPAGQALPLIPQISFCGTSGTLLAEVMEQYDAAAPENACETCLQAIHSHHRNAEIGACTGYLDLLLGRLERWLKIPGTADMQHQTRFALAALDISIYHLQGVDRAQHILEQASSMAAASGNKRMQILLTFGKGVMAFFTGIAKHREAYDICDKATAMLECLNDDGLRSECLPFYLLMRFLAGDHQQVIEIFEEVQRKPRRFLLPQIGSQMVIQAASAATYRGIFPYAEGMLKSAISTAEIEGDRMRALLYRQHLGVLYAYMRRVDDALASLQEVLASPSIATASKLMLRTYAGIALCYAYQGKMKMSYQLLSGAFAQARKDTGLSLAYNYPWMLDLAEVYTGRGFETLPELDFDELFKRMEAGPSQMLRGHALRLKASLQYRQGSAPEMILPLLDAGLTALNRADAPLERGLALDLKGQVLTDLGRHEEAAQARKESRRILAPLDLPPSVMTHEVFLAEAAQPASRKNPVPLFSKFCTEIAAFQEWETLEEYCNGLSACLRRLFHAECTAVFRHKEGLDGMGLCNISVPELEDEMFAERRAFLADKILKDRGGYQEISGFDTVCIPFQTGNGERWLLYAGSAVRTSCLRRCADEELHNMGLFCAAELKNVLRVQQERSKSQESNNMRAADSLSSTSRDAVVGHSGPFKACLERARIVASTDAAVLLLGETGVGKEVLAGYLHRHSTSKGPLVCVHPAALSESLFENEFFGHEKGAFTGAGEKKIGFCELADKGTLFIDEVGDIPMNMQIKLLRVLQEHRFTRVGGTTEVHSSFRLVAATNRDLRKAVREGTFREDLYYRIAVFPIEIPPLRDRNDDIEALFIFYTDHFARRYAKKTPYPDEATLRLIRSYAWPGNIRELRNAVESAVILYNGESSGLRLAGLAPAPSGSQRPEAGNLYADMPSMQELQRRYIQYVLDKTGGRISGEGGAEQILGMKRSTLYVKLREYGIRREGGSRTD